MFEDNKCKKTEKYTTATCMSVQNNRSGISQDETIFLIVVLLDHLDYAEDISLFVVTE